MNTSDLLNVTNENCSIKLTNNNCQKELSATKRLFFPNVIEAMS